MTTKTVKNSTNLRHQDCVGGIWSDVIDSNLETLANNLTSVITFSFQCLWIPIGAHKYVTCEWALTT